jgi:Sulfatase
MMKGPWIIHPFLIAPLPILFLYSRNLHAIEVSQVWLPAGLALMAAVISWGTLRAFRLDGPRAALLVSASLILFFSFGHAARLAGRWGLCESRVGAESLTLAVEALVLASVVGLIVRKADFARSLNGACNASALTLAGLCLIGVATGSLGESGTPPPMVAEPVVPRLSANSGRLPDVYFLVLDAYGRSDVLEEMYGLDNTEFLERLERKGFAVARRSRSNYCQTALSLSATLNFRYLDDLAGSRSTDRLPLKRLIVENAVFRAFRGLGYRLVTFASGFDATESIEADLTLAPRSNLGTFPALVADQTPLWLLLGRRGEHEPHRMHRDRILKVFEELPSASHPAPTPTFTFAHILSPHPPFIFGADGRDLSERERAYTLNDSEGWCRLEGHSGPDDYVRRYRDQVTSITSRVEEVVDRILATSSVPPIIIIQGDHGPGSHFDSGSEHPNDLWERTGILNACYLPGFDRESIDDAITPVNTFRMVLDHYFGAGLGLLEDRTYYSAYQSPYVFIDVTGEEELTTP